MKKIRNNKGVKPKWMNEEIKRLIKETKIIYQIQKNVFVRGKSSEIQAAFAKQERGNQEMEDIM